MPNTYHFDLGFDWDANPAPDSPSGNRYLQIGIAQPQSGTATGWGPGALTRLHPGDTILFYIYDVSEAQDPSQTLQLDADWFTTAAGDERTTFASPFATSIPAADVSTPGRSASSYFSDPNTQSPVYPAWTVVPQGNSAAPLQLTVNNVGQFLYGFKIKVTRGNEARTFSADPEMVVEPSNP